MSFLDFFCDYFFTCEISIYTEALTKSKLDPSVLTNLYYVAL